MALLRGIIKSLTYVEDTETATCVLSSDPGGTEEFFASRLPLYDTSEALTFTGTGTTRTLTFPCTGLWYVWGHEAGALDPGDFHAIVINDTFLNFAQLGVDLAALLDSHSRGIEAVLRMIHPSTTLKYCQYGYGGDIERYPGIIVTEPKYRMDWAALPTTDEYTLVFEIVCLTQVSSNDTNELTFASRMASIVMEILNMPPYVSFETDSGMKLYDCKAYEGNSKIFLVAEARFAGMATVIWTCKTLISPVDAC